MHSLIAKTRLISRNIIAASGRSSMRLEPETWEALREICQRERVGLAGLVQRVEGEGSSGSRTSAVRVFVLGYFKAAATEEGHAAVGHGGLE
jgi:predicted DNA-binding ribbon-helix-helix protein